MKQYVLAVAAALALVPSGLAETIVVVPPPFGNVPPPQPPSVEEQAQLNWLQYPAYRTPTEPAAATIPARLGAFAIHPRATQTPTLVVRSISDSINGFLVPSISMRVQSGPTNMLVVVHLVPVDGATLDDAPERLVVALRRGPSSKSREVVLRRVTWPAGTSPSPNSVQYCGFALDQNVASAPEFRLAIRTESKPLNKNRSRTLVQRASRELTMVRLPSERTIISLGYGVAPIFDLVAK